MVRIEEIDVVSIFLVDRLLPKWRRASALSVSPRRYLFLKLQGGHIFGVLSKVLGDQQGFGWPNPKYEATGQMGGILLSDNASLRPTSPSPSMLHSKSCQKVFRQQPVNRLLLKPWNGTRTEGGHAFSFLCPYFCLG